MKFNEPGFSLVVNFLYFVRKNTSNVLHASKISVIITMLKMVLNVPLFNEASHCSIIFEFSIETLAQLLIIE